MTGVQTCALPIYGYFTGISIAAGDEPANITIDVYPVSGGSAKTANLSLGAREQLSKQLSELLPSIGTQAAGSIQIRSDRPIWSWEILVVNGAMAAAPPLP